MFYCMHESNATFVFVSQVKEMSVDRIRIFDRSTSSAHAWDDKELIAAWNAQLQRLQSEKATADAAASGDDNDDQSDAESSSCSSQLQPALDMDSHLCAQQQQGRTSVVSKRQREDEEDNAGDAAVAAMPPIPNGVPVAMHSLLRAWFLAGFETGKYTATAVAAQKR